VGFPFLCQWKKEFHQIWLRTDSKKRVHFLSLVVVVARNRTRKPVLWTISSCHVLVTIASFKDISFFSDILLVIAGGQAGGKHSSGVVLPTDSRCRRITTSRCAHPSVLHICLFFFIFRFFQLHCLKCRFKNRWRRRSEFDRKLYPPYLTSCGCFAYHFHTDNSNPTFSIAKIISNF
jgi:hypothetical protein